MKFSEQWLREWVNPAITTQQLADQLTMAGLEVEAVEPVAADIDQVIVGSVAQIDKHPDADKLQVCSVDVGNGQALQIVCGASNVVKGGKYPVALIGAVLPNGLKIKKSKLRGVESSGMLCSATELGMAEQAEGLMTLPAGAPVGQSITDFLQLNDVSIELSLTPNRGDCLSVAGVAREVAVLNKTNVTPRHAAPVAPQCDSTFPVEIAAKQECPRYVGRVIKNVDPARTSPMWMQERLRRSGLRSISPTVDVTNYVLLELGQPMHAFDLDKLSGGITVRLASEGEEITLLDGQNIKLKAGTLVIADHKQPVALAGIMGGEESAVSDASKNIFLESAFFAPECIAGRARSYGLHTDSSHRFERGVDPALQELAMERATELLLEIVGGEPGPVISQQVKEFVPQRDAILLRHERLQKVLGTELDTSVVDDILFRLELQHVEQEHGWTVTPPSFRFDIEREEDLIEEVARIYGYDKIPVAHAQAPAVMLPVTESRVTVERIQNVLIDRGYQEAITYSFVDPNIQRHLHSESGAVTLANPISADLSEMRTTLWSGLVGAVIYNLNRQQTSVRLFETGLRFLQTDSGLQQHPMIAGVVTGNASPMQWGQGARNVDLFDIKSDVEAIVSLTGQADTFIFVADRHPALHPGQTAKILRHTQLNQKHADNKSEESEEIGWLGTLHPAVSKKLGIEQPIFLFEIKLAAVTQREIPHFEEIPKFPSIKRDLAIVVDEGVSAQAVSDCIRRVSTVMLTNLKLFDVYQGKGIDSGRKSLAFSLTLQDRDRTLTDQDVDVAIDEILSTLNRELGATLRT
ncbi:MAG: phenylalanyl-tRNA synthetase [Gammaproteobacteria bacterium SG8_15]|nr:MAG: phenylalanyl-tRNA synthetase [Gammaproteobacteria bacterium SG8_15]